jgi:uncharacterized protein YqiB (DUF1249 family)
MTQSDYGLKAKEDHLKTYQNRLTFLKEFKIHLQYEIHIIEYKLTVAKSTFYSTLLEIRKTELKNTEFDIKSTQTLIDYFKQDIEMYHFLKNNLQNA